MKKIWIVCSLQGAVVGFGNSGIEHDDNCFVFNRKWEATFDTEKEAVDYIESSMIDYKRRNVEGVRLVILTVYCSDSDSKFIQ